MAMSAGDYDVRVRTVDSRGQTSDWTVSEDMFELANGRPSSWLIPCRPSCAT